MKTLYQVNEINNLRIVFIETVSRQFVAVTGCGIYAFLNPVTIEELFNHFLNGNVPINAFAKQCVRDLVV